MSDYTKGPWRVSDEVAHRVIDDCATIAHCNVSSREGDEVLANARLIAAAPEMAEMLLEVRKFFAGSAQMEIDIILKKAGVL